MSYLKDSAFTAVKTDAKFEIRYVKGLSSLLSHVSGASSCQDQGHPTGNFEKKT